MIRVKVLRPVRLFSGRIQLSKKQVRGRLANLEPLQGGTYKIVKPVEFKVGEIIGVDKMDKGVNRHLEKVLTPAQIAKADAAEAAKVKAAEAAEKEEAKAASTKE